MSFQKPSIDSLRKIKENHWVKKLAGRTIYQRILRIYFITAFVGAVLLTLPSSRKSSESFNLFDGFFTAISAFTNTGLTTHTTVDTFNFWGQLVLLILIQAGGLGFLTIIIFLWAWLRRGGTFNVEQRWFLHFERGSYKRVESLPAVKTGITVLLVAELIGAFILTFFFYFATPLHLNNSDASTTTTVAKAAASSTPNLNAGIEQYQGQFWKCLWAGIFHSVSAANNAGFDLLGKYSIMPYRNDENNLLSVVLLVESIVGGIGYPVFYDCYLYYKNKRANMPWGISLFSKIAIVTYCFISVMSILLIIIFETGTAMKYPTSILYGPTVQGSDTLAVTRSSFGWGSNQLFNKLWNLVYLTFSSRSSGFSSIDTTQLTEASRWLLSILMFIGTSPASTGGGIRTITIYIIFARMLYTAIGKKHLSVYHRTIDQKIVFESCNVFVMSTMLIVVSAFFIIISLTSSSFARIGDVVFEASSAFGTAGLTSGITAQCNYFGKLVLILLMFVGQLGVSNALISLTDLQPKSKNSKFCSENLRII